MLLQKDLPTLPCIKSGLAVELSSIRKHNFGSWNDLKDWMQNLLGNFNPVSVSALQKSVAQLQSTKEKLQKNKHRNGEAELKLFLECPYKLPEQRTQTSKRAVAKRIPPHQSTFMKEAVNTVNKSLATENAELRAKILVGSNILLSRDKEITALKEKLRRLNPHNMRRQLKRKNSKIANYNATIAHFKKEIKLSTHVQIKKFQDQVRYYIAKCELLTQRLKEAECDTDCTLESKIEQLKGEKIDLLHINAEYKDTIKELQSSNKKLTFYEKGKYTDDIRMCIMELLSHNVGILNVVPVIQSVLHMAGLEYDRLPKHTAINEMIVESRSLAQMQVAETLLQAPNATLHTDGTSKFGHKYMSYQVSTTEGSLTLGIQVNTCRVAHSILLSLHLLLYKH